MRTGIRGSVVSVPVIQGVGIDSVLCSGGTASKKTLMPPDNRDLTTRSASEKARRCLAKSRL